MKTKSLLYLFVAFVGSCSTIQSDTPSSCSKIPAEESQNHLIMSTLWYQRSSEMRALCYQAYNWARIVVDQRLLEPPYENLAVILDIDETILDNSPFQAELILRGESYHSDLWYKWTQQASASALPGAVNFCQYLYEKNIEIFYISNRTVREMNPTINNLSELGFPFSDQDHLLLKTSTSSKKIRREKISDSHEIILLMGDNLNDFSSIFEDRSDHNGHLLVDQYAAYFGNRFIVLPNPMYGAWETALTQQEQFQNQADKITQLKKQLTGYQGPE